MRDMREIRFRPDNINIVEARTKELEKEKERREKRKKEKILSSFSSFMINKSKACFSVS